MNSMGDNGMGDWDKCKLYSKPCNNHQIKSAASDPWGMCVNCFHSWDCHIIEAGVNFITDTSFGGP